MSLLIKTMEQLERSYFFTGSYAICGTLTSDFDAVVIFDDKLDDDMTKLGYVSSTKESGLLYPNSSVVRCYRRGDKINIIAVEDQNAYQRWYQATALAREMNLQEKIQRVLLFQFLTEGQLRDGQAVNPDWTVPETKSTFEPWELL